MPDRDNRLNILLLADNSYSMEVMRQALEASRTRCRLLKCGVGPKTIPYLRREDAFADAPIPDLVLFDVVNAGHETLSVLKDIKAEPELRALPLVLLTSDDAEPPFEELTLGPDRYTTFSPVDLDSFLSTLNTISPSRFMRAISLLESFGFVLVRLPDLSDPMCDDSAGGGTQSAA